VNESRTNPDAAADAHAANGNPAPADTVTVSAEELEQLRKKAGERDSFLDLLQRTRAEFENYQKRNQKEREQERRYAYGPLVRATTKTADRLNPLQFLTIRRYLTLTFSALIVLLIVVAAWR